MTTLAIFSMTLGMSITYLIPFMLLDRVARFGPEWSAIITVPVMSLAWVLIIDATLLSHL